MTEFGLLWRMRKGDDEFTASLGYDEARGHVLILAHDGRELSRTAFDRGPIEVIAAAGVKRAELVERGWTEVEPEELRIFDAGL